VTAPSTGALSAAGYAQNVTGIWTQTFGTIAVTFDLRDEPDMGLLTVTPSGDDAGTDVANATASLVSLGYPGLSYTVAPDGNDEDLGSVTGLSAYSMSL
jgi:hypothetical protein